MLISLQQNPRFAVLFSTPAPMSVNADNLYGE